VLPRPTDAGSQPRSRSILSGARPSARRQEPRTPGDPEHDGHGGEDIPLLIESFIAEFNLKYAKRVHGVNRDALDILSAQPWPGNVRQLRNSIEWAVLTCDNGVVMPGCLPPAVPAPAGIDHVAARVRSLNGPRPRISLTS
jgi:hypothetical protein